MKKWLAKQAYQTAFILRLTLNHADVLVSWNFKHIVNVHRIRGYNSVNYKFGHKILEIRTPREILEYED